MTRVAAIDCGTNTIRLLIAEATATTPGVPAWRCCAAVTRSCAWAS